MATLRIVLLMGLLALTACAQAGAGVMVSGTIAAVDTTNMTITLAPPPATAGVIAPAVKFFYTAKTRFFKNGVEAKPGALVVGDMCAAECVRERDRLIALSVKVKSPEPPKPQLVKGRIREINYDTGIFELLIGEPGATGAHVMGFAANDQTKIAKDGLGAAFADLKSGDMAVVGFRPSPVASPGPTVALTIQAHTPPESVGHVKGMLVERDLDKRILGVMPGDWVAVPADPVVRVFVPETAKITKFWEVPLAGLNTRDHVAVTFIKRADSPLPVALAVEALPERITGIVDHVDIVAGAVAVKMTPTGPAGPYKVVDGRTKITRNGVIVGLGDLKAGDLVRLAYFRFPEANIAVMVDARSIRGK